MPETFVLLTGPRAPVKPIPHRFRWEAPHSASDSRKPAEPLGNSRCAVAPARGRFLTPEASVSVRSRCAQNERFTAVPAPGAASIAWVPLCGPVRPWIAHTPPGPEGNAMFEMLGISKRTAAALAATVVLLPLLVFVGPSPSAAHEQTTQRCDYDPISGQNYNCRNVPVSHVHAPCDTTTHPPPDTSPTTTAPPPTTAAPPPTTAAPPPTTAAPPPNHYSPPPDTSPRPTTPPTTAPPTTAAPPPNHYSPPPDTSPRPTTPPPNHYSPPPDTSPRPSTEDDEAEDGDGQDGDDDRRRRRRRARRRRR